MRLLKGQAKNRHFLTVKHAVPSTQTVWPRQSPGAERRAAITSCAQKIQRLLQDLGSEGHAHVFDGSGQMVAKCITIDQHLQVRQIDVTVYQPVNSGGHLFGRGRAALKPLILGVFSEFGNKDDRTIDQSNLVVYASKAENADALILYSEDVAESDLFSELPVERHQPDPGETDSNLPVVYGYEIRLNDGRTLGKSVPKISDGKFQALFPGVPIDKSKVATHSKKRKRSDFVLEPVPKAAVAGMIRDLGNLQCHPGEKASHGILAHILTILHVHASHTTHVLRTLAMMPPQLRAAVLADPEFVRNAFAEAGIRDDTRRYFADDSSSVEEEEEEEEYQEEIDAEQLFSLVEV